MKNIQCLIESGGLCKYFCKYVGNIDKNNYCIVSTYYDDSLIICYNILHNTKRVTSEKYQQEEWDKRQKCKHPQGEVISVNEFLHQMFKYPEVITNENFVITQTTSLETRTGKSPQNPDNPESKNFT